MYDGRSGLKILSYLWYVLFIEDILFSVYIDLLGKYLFGLISILL